MRSFSFAIAIVLAGALLTPRTGAAHDHETGTSPGVSTRMLPPPSEVCFAPHTDQVVVDAYNEGLSAARAAMPARASANFSDDGRWNATATNGPGLRRGDPTTLTWSIVPDGTAIAGAVGEPASPSRLRAFLNGIYGSPAVWLPLLQRTVDRWSELTGVTYVYEPNDDGATMFQADGVLGVRGDVRIGGHPIDGDYGLLGYSYYPTIADMVLDTSDGFFTDTSNDSRGLRNLVTHELGHGLGLQHTCPLDGTKLMEPLVPLGVDGLQHDDLLGAQRLYGDDLEHNDAAANASDLGVLGNTATTVAGLSIDGTSDADWFSFRVGSGKKASVIVTPVGGSYRLGAQNADGTCSAGTPFDSRRQNELAVDVLDKDGATPLGSATAPRGQAVNVNGVALPGGGNKYYVRVRPGTSDAAQLYDVRLQVSDAATPSDAIFSDGFEEGNPIGWSRVVNAGHRMLASVYAAMNGREGLEVEASEGEPHFVEDSSPTAEGRYRARFAFDPNSFDPGTRAGRSIMFQALSTQPKNKKIISMLVRWFAGKYQIMVKVRMDSGGNRKTGWIEIPDRPHTIELDWRKSSAPGRNDGSFSLWIDGQLQSNLQQIDNDTRFLDIVRLGMIHSAPGAAGTIYLDDFVSRRSTYIGL